MATDEDAVVRFRMPEKQKEERWYPMSQSFRQVKEIWNMHSDCFIHPAGNSAQRQGHGDLPYIFRVKRHCFLSQIFSQTGTPRKAIQLAGY
jgi:hypothetical protein